MRYLHIAAYILGVIEALLLARFVLRVLAARPDNPVVAALMGLTWPLVAPFAALDAGRPQFGAILEFSSPAPIMLLLIGILVVLPILSKWRITDA
jgi:hypothetical protein